jgi:hypothetical protein
MKRIIHIKRSVKKVVRTLPGDALSGGKPRRVVITKTTTTSHRRIVR